jgi:hypothetical protein
MHARSTFTHSRSPWASIVLGALMIAAGSRALAAPPAPTPDGPTSAAPPPTSAATPSVAPSLARDPDALPPGQVWECTNNGQHVFSDKPCGAHASIRQLGALNTMPAPAIAPSLVRPSGRPPPPSWYSPGDAYGQDYSDDQDADSAAVMGGPAAYYGVIRRPAHPRPPPHHAQPKAAPAPHGPGVAKGR